MEVPQTCIGRAERGAGEGQVLAARRWLPGEWVRVGIPGGVAAATLVPPPPDHRIGEALGLRTLGRPPGDPSPSPLSSLKKLNPNRGSAAAIAPPFAQGLALRIRTSVFGS